MTVSARIDFAEDAPLEEKVAYLLRRDKAVQAELEDVRRDIAGLPERWLADIAREATSLRAEHAEELAKLRDRHLRARLLGIVLLVVGITLATWGNLV